jgi:DNA polymerase-1
MMNCIIADRPDDLPDIPEDWVVGIDIESIPIDSNRKQPRPWIDLLAGIGLSFYPPEGDTPITVYVRVYPEIPETESLLQRVSSLIRNRPWYAHNALFDLTYLLRYRLGPPGPLAGDPRILAYLLGEPEASLKPLLQRYLRIDTLEYTELLRTYRARHIGEVPLEEVARYCASQDAEQVVRLERIMRSELADSNPKALRIYSEIELPVVPMLAEMTLTGIRFDRNRAYPMLEEYQRGLEAIDRIIVEQAERLGYREYEKRNGTIWYPVCPSCRNGKNKRVSCERCSGAGRLPPVPVPFNPASWQQKERLLYDVLKLPKKRFAGGKKEWEVEDEQGPGSTDSLALLQLRDKHPIVPLFIIRSRLSKDTGFLKQWITLSEKDGRLHTEFTNTTVVSGRLSSRSPNLQQVTQKFRHLFIADPDTVIVSGDMSQLELTIAAFVSRDPKLCEAIRNDWDLHRITASAIYGIPWQEIPKESTMRVIAKMVNYLSNYGGQHELLREQLEKLALSNMAAGIPVPSREECMEFLKAHKRLYSTYWSWVYHTIEKTRQLGYSETVFGRPRYFPDIDSRDEQKRKEAERACVNHVIQGTAADLMKLAMRSISLDTEMSAWGRVVLQVHDELVCLVDRRYSEVYGQKLKQHMELQQPFEPYVPLRVDVAWGHNWAEAHK